MFGRGRPIPCHSVIVPGSVGSHVLSEQLFADDECVNDNVYDKVAQAPGTSTPYHQSSEIDNTFRCFSHRVGETHW